MDSNGNGRDYIRSIERGFAVLLAFDADRPRPTSVEVAEVTGLSRPAVRRILLTLQRLGYVSTSGGRWSLTPRVLTIAQHYSATHGLIEIAQPYLLRVAEQTHESASLSTLDGADVVYLARVQVRRVMSINVDVGTRVPTHATSMGRVLLAWEAPSKVQEVLGSRPLRRYTDRTITDPARLRDDLRAVRRRGWAIVESELEEGLLSASAPVRDHRGAVVAALAYSTSVGRRTVAQIEVEVVPLLLATAREITSMLGFAEADSTGPPYAGQGNNSEERA